MDGVVKYANDAMASGHRVVGDILRIRESRGARHQRISRVCVETYRMVSHRWLGHSQLELHVSAETSHDSTRLID